MKPKHHYSDLLQMNFYFFMGWKPEHYAQYLEQECGHKIGTPGNGKTVFIQDEKCTGIFVWVRDTKDHVTLAHECLHAANFTLEFIGHESSADNDEITAYTMSHIIRAARGQTKDSKPSPLRR